MEGHWLLSNGKELLSSQTPDSYSFTTVDGLFT